PWSPGYNWTAAPDTPTTRVWQIHRAPPRPRSGLANILSRFSSSGGGGGIRTPDGCYTITVFKTVAIDHSATPPTSSWQGGRDSNPQPTVLETATLPIELPPYSRPRVMLLFLSTSRRSAKADGLRALQIIIS